MYNRFRKRTDKLKTNGENWNTNRSNFFDYFKILSELSVFFFQKYTDKKMLYPVRDTSKKLYILSCENTVQILSIFN